MCITGTAFAENNSNYIFNGTTTNFGGALYIPFTSPGTNNSLQIFNGGSVTNTGGGIGVLNSGDDYNYAIVSDPGSLWYSSGNISIGSLGSDNFLLITNGGYVRMAGEVYVGSSGSFSNRVIVTDPGSVWSVGGRLHAGYAGLDSSLIITNGGVVGANQTWQGGWAGSSNHTLIVSGPGSILSNVYDLSVGVYANSGGNRVTVENGGRIVGASTAIGAAADAGNNLVTVTGSGSVWSNTSYFRLGGGYSSNNLLIVRDGAMLRSDGGIEIGYTGSNNVAVVTDPGSRLSAASIMMGPYGRDSILVISNGAGAVAPNLYMGSGTTGLTSSNSTVLVTGAGSFMSNSTVTYVGYAGTSNTLILANGGRLYSTDAYLGFYRNPSLSWVADNNLAVVTGTGSIWTVAGTLRVGYDGLTNNVLITDGGMLEVNTIVTGPASVNTVSNRGGIYQFTSANPAMYNYSPNGTIMMSNATISYKGVAAADINNTHVGFIAKQGDNTFQLDNSTNVNVTSYTFNTGNPSNYYRLVLKNGSRFQATTTTFGSGGVLIGNGTVASANVTNHGTIAPGLLAGEITFTSNLVLGATSQLLMEIGGTNPADYDRLIVNGSLTLTGTLSVAMINAFSPTVGDTFTLIDNTGTDPVSGYFTGLTNNAFIDASGYGIEAFFRIQYDGGTGNDVILIATIPEPSILCLLGIGLLFLRRKQNG